MKFPTSVDKVAFAGDWHGNTHWAVHILHELAKQGVKVVIHLGDYGWRFDEEYIREQNYILADNDMLLLFIDGNHEDFDYLYNRKVAEDGTRKIADRIWHLPRGFRWEWEEVKFLALGGSFSIDKHQRLRGFTWWPEEAITAVDMRKATNGGETDVLVTHDVAISSDIKKLMSKWLPEKIVVEADEQRKILQEVAEATRPVLWWHGHYHQAYQDVIEFDNGQECQVTGLDCDGSSFGENVNIISMNTIKNLVEDKKVSTT